MVHIVRVEGVDAVILGGDDRQRLLRSVGALSIRDDQRLSVNVTVDDPISKLSKGLPFDVGNTEIGFLEICAGTEIIVVVRQHADLRGRRHKPENS